MIREDAILLTCTVPIVFSGFSAAELSHLNYDHRLGKCEAFASRYLPNIGSKRDGSGRHSVFIRTPRLDDRQGQPTACSQFGRSKIGLPSR